MEPLHETVCIQNSEVKSDKFMLTDSVLVKFFPQKITNHSKSHILTYASNKENWPEKDPIYRTARAEVHHANLQAKLHFIASHVCVVRKQDIYESCLKLCLLLLNCTLQ